MRRSILGVAIAVVLVAAGRLEGAVQQWTVASGGNGHFYDLIESGPGWVDGLHWDQARVEAESLSFVAHPWVYEGHLATITSASENLWLTATFGGDALHLHWIGAYQPPGSPEPDGGWTWVTGETWDYTNWFPPGEPNDRDGIEDVAVFDHGVIADGKAWNDLPASSLFYYVVEYEPTARIPEPSTLIVWSLLAVLGIFWYRRRK